MTSNPTLAVEQVDREAVDAFVRWNAPDMPSVPITIPSFLGHQRTAFLSGYAAAFARHRLEATARQHDNAEAVAGKPSAVEVDFMQALLDRYGEGGHLVELHDWRGFMAVVRKHLPRLASLTTQHDNADLIARNGWTHVNEPPATGGHYAVGGYVTGTLGRWFERAFATCIKTLDGPEWSHCDPDKAYVPIEYWYDLPGHPEAADALQAMTASPREVETEAWNWFARHPGLELSHSWDEDEQWVVHRVTGGRNDREWTLLSNEGSPLEAVLAARTALGEGQ